VSGRRIEKGTPAASELLRKSRRFKRFVLALHFIESRAD
jgi:hypothetical protein